MKILVTGVAGQLGRAVLAELRKRGCEAIGSDLRATGDGLQLDITDRAATERIICALHPDAVIHCAAWTAVDAAEDEQNKSKVWDINVQGTGNIARSCAKIEAKLLYISTDYVFNGQGTKPWVADSQEFGPLNFYGESKLAGEREVVANVKKYFIVRTAWVFGEGSKNFVRTMLDLGKKYASLRVVCDQIGTPTYAVDLARLLVDMIATEKYGYYHATNEGGYVSWYDFACEILRRAGYATRVIPVTTAEYGESVAVRPSNSRLDKSKLVKYGLQPLPAWQDALERYLMQEAITK